MTSVVDVMSDAIGALDYATDALEAPAGSQMRQTVLDLKDARRTVADMLTAMDNLLALTELHIAERSDTPEEEEGYLSCFHMIQARAAIKAARGEAQ